MAEVTGGCVTVEIDAADIEHLIKSGTATVTDPDADVQVKVRCREEIAIKAEVLE